MKSVSIVAVGTELTDGEIINRNGAWLAKQLQQMGFAVDLQIMVPDDRKKMLNTFQIAFETSDIVFIGGGLGPTSDDFTREIVAEFTEDKLDFDEAVFQQLVELYKNRGLVIREAHKQQCFFPTRRQLLPNSVGTALGFICDKQGKKIFVLPGPPKEFDAIFNEECRPLLEQWRPKDFEELLSWRTLAIPESEVAEVVEPLVKKWGLKVGYRASVPYVIVKVWIAKSWESNGKKYQFIQELEDRIGRWVVAQGSEDLAKNFIQKISKFSSCRILDSATAGKLTVRLQEFVDKQTPKPIEIVNRFYNASMDEYFEPVQANFSVRLEGSEYRITAEVEGRALSVKLALPFKIAASSERGQASICEQAIWHWLKFLEKP